LLLRKQKALSYLVDILFIFFGTAVYAFGVYAFTAPNQIAPGGVTGIAIVIHAFTGFRIGTLVTLFNIPLLLFGFRTLGKRFTANTLFSTLFFNLQVDYLFPFLPTYQGNPILAAVFGGLFIGLGLAIVFMRGGSTGGLDIVSRSIQQRFPHISLGKIVFVSDLAVILTAAAAFRSLESALYAVIAMFISSKALDSLLYGTSVGKVITIISEESDRIAAEIIETLGRGCTILPAEGGYRKAPKNVLLCVCKDAEFYELKALIRKLDRKAFVIVEKAEEVFGEGFSQITKR